MLHVNLTHQETAQSCQDVWKLGVDFALWVINKKDKTMMWFNDLRLLPADGSFVPVSTCAEVLLLGPSDLLESAHVGSEREGRWGTETVRVAAVRGRAGERGCGRP